MPLLIFTDLDGTLLEHDTYSVEPARPALAELNRRGIALILNSSKTAAEIASLQTNLGLAGPFICENGAALFESPGAPPESFGVPLEQWLGAVHSARQAQQFKFSGFSDWSPSEIAKLTGLLPEQASQAKQRQYSEPILWQDSLAAKAEFVVTLKDLGLQLLEGGRFMSIQSQFDKSDAMHWLTQKLGSAANPMTTVALGDSPNDAAMLNKADIAVIIKSAKSEQILCPNAGTLIKTRKTGPSGWNEAILDILSKYDTNQLNQTS